MYDKERKGIRQDLTSGEGARINVDAVKLDNLVERYEVRLGRQKALLEKQQVRILDLERERRSLIVENARLQREITGG